MFQLFDDEAPQCDDLEIEIVMNGRMITVPIAEHIGDGRIISLECFMVPGNRVMCKEIPETNYLEFGYYFSLSSEWGRSPVVDLYDRDVVRTYLPPGCQEQILSSVAACSQALVLHLSPRFLFRRTNAPHLPTSAIRKYDLITEAIHDVGYQTKHQGTDDEGHRFWVMTPASPALTAGVGP